MKRSRMGTIGNTRKAERIVVAAALSVVAFGTVTPVKAATKTWTGAIADPNSPTYQVSPAGATVGFAAGMNIYQWNGSVQNWSSGGVATTFGVGTTNVLGDAAVFTDNFTGGTLIDLTSSNVNPASMTFTHIAGSTPTTYTFLLSGDFLTSTGGNVNSSSPFGAFNPSPNPGGPILTLDAGFLGKVILRAQTDTNDAQGNTIIKSGILELQEINSAPGTVNRQNMNVNLAGGELDINIISPRSGNTQPDSNSNAGTYTVTANSVLALTRDQGPSVNGGAVPTSSRTLNGNLMVNGGVTLTLKSPNNVRMQLGSNLNNGTLASTGTFLLADGTNGFATILQLENANGAPSATFDTGVGTSILQTNQTAYTMGALTGGPGTTLRANGSGSTVFSIGAANGSSTFSGTIADSVANTFSSNSSTAITKVGTGTLVLTGTNTYTAQTTVSLGTLSIAGAGGSILNSAPTSTGGVLLLDNTVNNNDRLGNTVPVTLNQGSFEFVGNLSAQTNENTGTLNVIAGANNVRASSIGSGGNATITFAGLNRTGGYVNFDTTAGTNIAFATAPTLTNGIIGGYATANTNDFASLSGNNVVALAAGSYNTSNNPTNWLTTDNVNLTATSPVATAANQTINSLKISGANAELDIASGTTLNVAAAGILETASGTVTIGGSGTLTAGSGSSAAELDIIVPNGTGVLKLNAPIADNTASGTVSILKAGPGKLVLASQNNSFTGAISLTGGTLQVGAANVLSANGGLTVDLGTTFDLGGFNQGVATTTLINGQIINSGGAASLSTASLINVRAGTISASLAGAGSLNKTTGSLVTLSASNSYTGGTTVGAGTLNFTNANALPSGGSVTFAGGTASLSFSGGANVGQVTVTGGTVSGTGSLISNADYDMQGTGTVNVVLSGNVGLNKTTNNNGSVTLAASNTYTGVTTISVGSLQTNILNPGGQPSGIGQSSNAASNLVFNGTSSNGAFLVYTGGTAATTDRLFTIQDGANNIVAAGGTNGTLTFSNTGAIVRTGGGTLALRGGNTGANTFNPKLPSDLTLSKNDGGQWILGQANTIDKLIDGNGTLGIGTNSLTVNNASFTAGSLVGTTGVFTINNDFQFGGGNITVVVADGTNGAVGLNKQNGTGSLLAANTISGPITMNGGILNVATLTNGGIASGIGKSSSADSNLQFNGSATLSYVGSVATSTDRQFQLNSSNAGFAANGTSGTATLTVGSSTFQLDNHGNSFTLAGGNTGSNTFASSITGGGGLNKADGGQWVLTGTSHTYTGVVTLSGGNLTISSIANGGVQANITTTNGSNQATIDNAAGIGTGQFILAGNLPAGTTITAISGTNITLSKNATSDGSSGGTFGFTNPLGLSTNSPDNLVFSGGTLKYTGPTASTDRQFTIINGGGIDSSGAGPLSFTNTGTANVTGPNARTFTVGGINTGLNTLAASLKDSDSGSLLSVTKSGVGQWVLTGTNTYTGTTTVQAGTLNLVGPNAWAPALSGTSASVVGGTVLTGGRLNFDYTGNADPATTIKNILTAGAPGNFLAGQIRTTTAADGKHAIGWIDDTANSKVRVAYTYSGDANVDGIVNTLDFNALAANFNVTTNTIWSIGDFNYDGKVNMLDFNGLATNFGATPIAAPTFDAPALGTLVPEPASLGLLGSIALLGLRRRRTAR